VDDDALADEYNELALDAGSTRLVVDGFAKPARRKVGFDGIFPGEGKLGPALASLSLDRAMFLGLNSFILEVLDFVSLSWAGPMLGLLNECCGRPGEGRGLLPFGNATFAAVVAASLLPPTDPLLYANPKPVTVPVDSKF
jgi:hypothetical protein